MNKMPYLRMQGYELVSHYQGCLGSQEIILGSRGPCRFCSATNPKKFRTKSHTIAEGLGNKWLISLDECDDCNKKFQLYDDALCKSVGVILTLGGVLGKKNKTRKTGRTKDGHNIRHIKDDNGRHISFGALDLSKLSSLTGTTLSFGGKSLTLHYPSPPEYFIPSNSRRRLLKIGKLLSWIQNPQNEEDFPVLEVAFSVGNLGNSPQIASVSILRRKIDNSGAFHSIAVICVGSCCWALDLKPDLLDNHLPPILSGAIKINWSTILGIEPNTMEIKYRDLTHFNWADNNSRLTPVEALKISFNYETTEGVFIPKYRSMQ